MRLVLFLNKIFNYMWIEAMFVNITLTGEECIVGALCLDATWLIHRSAAIIFTQFVGIPAKHLMYVTLGLAHKNVAHAHLLETCALSSNRVSGLCTSLFAT